MKTYLQRPGDPQGAYATRLPAGAVDGRFSSEAQRLAAWRIAKCPTWLWTEGVR